MGAHRDEGDFLARWSRRKARARHEGDQEETQEAASPGRTPRESAGDTSPEVAAADAAPSDPDALSEAELAELEATDFDALDAGSDYTRFMRAGVPEALRRRALSRLWVSDPVLANVDGLNDYDLDYRIVKGAGEAIATAWRAGKGYLSDEEIAASDAEAYGVPEKGGPIAEADAGADADAATETSDDIDDAPEARQDAGPDSDTPDTKPV